MTFPKLSMHLPGIRGFKFHNFGPGTSRLWRLTHCLFYHFTPKRDEFQTPLQPHQKYNIQCGQLGLAYSLLRWKMIIPPILITSLIHIPKGWENVVFDRWVLTWWRLSISRPTTKSMAWSCNTEKDEGRKSFSIWIWATWTRPVIFCVPTPLATPAHRWSISRLMLHLSAQAELMNVICAPESMKAFTGCPFSLQLM